MRILVGIDDTDNLNSKGTGELASTLAGTLLNQGWGTSSYVTRHQLLVDPAIPYTSHNSSMAFFAELIPGGLEKFTAHAADYLVKESAAGSDPGLCVVDLERLPTPGDLIEFGALAKKQVLSKDQAYRLAQSLDVHLSEHGGTGLGVIGALAGVGLRLGGNDGRLRGQLSFPEPSERVSVAQLLAHPSLDLVRCENGYIPYPEESVRLQDKIKTVLLEGQAVLLVEPDDQSPQQNCWRNLRRQQLKGY